MKLIVAKSIDDYISIISKEKNDGNIWFRGQQFSKYQLEPSLFRVKHDISIDEPHYKRERYLVKSDNYGIEKFKKHLEKFRDCSKLKEIDYLYLMQHYGIPTRLLDFTKDELIALYFSVAPLTQSTIDTDKEIEEFNSSYGFTENGSSVYCINPLKVNELSFQKKEIINLNDYAFNTLKNIDFPICILSNSIDTRIKAQKGVFVYFGQMIHPLDYYSVLESEMTKIFIPNSKRKEIKEELKDKYSISHSTVYPDMHGISLEIIDEMNEEYENRKKKYYWQ